MVSIDTFLFDEDFSTKSHQGFSLPPIPNRPEMPKKLLLNSDHGFQNHASSKRLAGLFAS